MSEQMRTNRDPGFQSEYERFWHEEHHDEGGKQRIGGVGRWSFDSQSQTASGGGLDDSAVPLFFLEKTKLP
jgi:hypothetical protein